MRNEHGRYWKTALQSLCLGVVIVCAGVSFATPKVARIAVTGDDSYILSVNGQEAARTSATPTATEWKNTRFVNVTQYLVKGRNVVAVRAVNAAGSAGVIVQLDLDGKPALKSDRTWRVLDAPTAPDGWNTAAFDDSGWTPAHVVAPLGGGPWGSSLAGWLGDGLDVPYMAHLSVLPVAVETLAGSIHGTGLLAGMRVHGRLPTMTVTPSSDPKSPTTLLVDFGQEVAGRVQIEGTPGTPLTVNTGESRAECLRLYAPKEHSGPYDLVLTGDVPASTPYSAFRYARLVFPGKNPAMLTGLTCDFQYYPVQYQGAFDCSDPLLTKIWYTGAYTSHLCMQEDIVDAPKRDRVRWIGDMQISGEVINNAFADTFLMEQTMTRLRAATQEGQPATELPRGEVNGIPGYSGAWFCTLADFYRHIGDDAYLKSQHTLILSQLAYERTDFDANNLFTNPHGAWDFCDWAIGLRGFRAPNSAETPAALETTDMYLIAGVREAVFLLRALHDKANADKYSAWVDTLTDAAQRAYFHADSGSYGSTLQENAMAVYSGVATPEQTQGIYKAILKADSPAWTVPLAAGKTVNAPMTPYYGNFVLQALDKSGNNDAAIALMRRFWGDMLRRGATTWWERFDPSYPDDMDTILTSVGDPSLCHGWSAGPTNYLTENVLGIRPTSGGFRTATIAPNLGSLTWAEGTVPTPGGVIHARVERKGSGYALTLTLPKTVAAQVGLPGKSLTVNGSKAATTISEGTAIVHLTGPGNYQISSVSGTE